MADTQPPQASTGLHGQNRGGRRRARGGGAGQPGHHAESQQQQQSTGGSGRGSRGKGRGARGGGGGGGRGGREKQKNSDANANGPEAGDQGVKEKQGTMDGAADEADDGEICFICASNVEHTSVSPCNHRTCHICALRLRALYKNKACAHCRVSGCVECRFDGEGANMSELDGSQLCGVYGRPDEGL